MPSTLVHAALAALLAAGLLGEDFDARTLAVVLAVTAFPDLDAFFGLVVTGGHRAILHSLFVPAALGAILAYDLYGRERSLVRSRWGRRGVHTAWVSLLAYVVAAIGIDLFVGGANVLYPLHDQFYRLNGEVVLSNQRGLVQTFVRQEAAVGSTQEVHISSGVDPNKGAEPKDVEREFPVVRAGWQALLVLSAVLVVSLRLATDARRPAAEE